MSEININVESGKSVKLLTAGKYVKENIVVTATGGSGGGSGEDLFKEFVEGFNNDWSYLCYQNKYENLDKFFENIDATSVTTASYMFMSCSNLKKSPTLYFSNVTNIRSIFQNCNLIEEINIYNTSKLTNMQNAFSYCSKLKSIKLNTDSITNIKNAFQNCSLLETVDITSLENVTSSSDANYAFNSAYSIKKIIIRNMTKVPPIPASYFNYCYHIMGTVNSTYNPNGDKDGYIYVPDDFVESLKLGTNWSTVASQIKGLSELNPKAYRLLTPDDVGKVFGVDLELEIQFDTSVYLDLSNADFFINNQTINLTNFVQASMLYDAGYDATVRMIHIDGSTIFQGAAFVLDTQTMTNGLEITSYNTEYDWNNFLYVKDI